MTDQLAILFYTFLGCVGLVAVAVLCGVVLMKPKPSAESGAPVTAGDPQATVIDDAHSRTIGQLAPKDAHTMGPLLDSGVLDGAATVRELSVLRGGRVLLRISVELTPLTASARR